MASQQRGTARDYIIDDDQPLSIKAEWSLRINSDGPEMFLGSRSSPGRGRR